MTNNNRQALIDEIKRQSMVIFNEAKASMNEHDLFCNERRMADMQSSNDLETVYYRAKGLVYSIENPYSE